MTTDKTGAETTVNAADVKYTIAPRFGLGRFG
jgi:hypothetical protein